MQLSGMLHHEYLKVTDQETKYNAMIILQFIHLAVLNTNLDLQ